MDGFLPAQLDFYFWPTSKNPSYWLTRKEKKNYGLCNTSLKKT